ncbi:hypothetical protein LXL04_036600 [Taraxacum kok-saghyz]
MLVGEACFIDADSTTHLKYHVKYWVGMMRGRKSMDSYYQYEGGFLVAFAFPQRKEKWKYWMAIKVHSGENFHVNLHTGETLHITQASLGRYTETKEAIYLQLEIDGKVTVVGTLLPNKLQQQQMKLVFNRKFHISHTNTNDIIHLYEILIKRPQYNHGYPFFKYIYWNFLILYLT